MTKKTRERLGKLLLFAHGYLCLMPPLVIITYSAAIESSRVFIFLSFG